MLCLRKGVEVVNCPHCGWRLIITEHSVDSDGYKATFICNSMKECAVEVKVNTNLLWAYEHNRITKDLENDAYTILLSAGLMPTPP